MSERGFGFICLVRGFLDHPRYKPRLAFSTAEAFIWLIESAAWKPCEVAVIAGHVRTKQPLLRGQLTFSVRFLSEKWRWSPGKVMRFLTALQADGTIDTQTDGQQTIITICNYSKYQLAPKTTDTQADTQADTQTGTPTDTKKNASNNKTKNPLGWPEDAFDRWWNIYPKSADKKDARRSFDKLQALGEIPFSDLMDATQRYAATCNPQFFKNGATWINKGSYLDGLPHPKAATTAETRAPETFTESDWRERLALHLKGNSWPESHWGPPPGNPGCLIPQSILIESNEGAAR